jgi:hypothetical protein
MRDRTTHGRGGREGGGRDGGGTDGARFQDSENERNISTALVEYDADDAQNRQSNDTLTDRGGRNGRSFGRGAYGRQGGHKTTFDSSHSSGFPSRKSTATWYQPLWSGTV